MTDSERRCVFVRRDARDGGRDSDVLALVLFRTSVSSSSTALRTAAAVSFPHAPSLSLPLVTYTRDGLRARDLRPVAGAPTRSRAKGRFKESAALYE